MAARVRYYKGAWVVVTIHKKRRKWQRVGATVAHKKLAEKIARKINAQLELGKAPITTSKTFAEVAELWFRAHFELPRGSDARAPSTKRLVRGLLDNRILPYFRTKRLDAIGVADVQGFYEHCLEERIRRGKKKEASPLSPRTIEVGLGILGRVFAYAEACELVSRNVVAIWKRARPRRGSAPKPIHENVLDGEGLAAVLEVAESEFPHVFPFVLFLADTGARLGEATALRWVDVDLKAGTARIRASSDGRTRRPTKTGKERAVELSTRLTKVLAQSQPDIYGDEALVFTNAAGGTFCPHNFRGRDFRRIVEKALGRGRRFTPHGLRHTFASLHLARGTNLKWIEAMGGWSGTQLLLNLYGHHLPTESCGYADAIAKALGRPRGQTRSSGEASRTTISR